MQTRLGPARQTRLGAWHSERVRKGAFSSPSRSPVCISGSHGRAFDARQPSPRAAVSPQRSCAPQAVCAPVPPSPPCRARRPSTHTAARHSKAKSARALRQDAILCRHKMLRIGAGRPEARRMERCVRLAFTILPNQRWPLHLRPAAPSGQTQKRVQDVVAEEFVGKQRAQPSVRCRAGMGATVSLPPLSAVSLLLQRAFTAEVSAYSSLLTCRVCWGGVARRDASFSPNLPAGSTMSHRRERAAPTLRGSH